MIRVHLAGRVPGRLEAVRARLLARGLEVTGASPSLDAALRADADVVVSVDGEVGTWRSAEPGPAVLVMSDARAAPALARAGHAAWGVVAPSAGGEELAAAVAAAARGFVVLPPNAVALLSRSGRPPDDPDDLDAESLTAREREVLELASRGLSNREVAAALGISEHTVKFHLASVYGKLGAGSRTDAVRRGLRRGLIAI